MRVVDAEKARCEAEALGLSYPDIKASNWHNAKFVLPLANTSQQGIHYELKGDPPTATRGLIVFIHGIGAHGSVDWQLLEPALRSCGYATLMYDSRGRGRSSALQGQRFDVDDHVEQLHGLMAELELSKTPHTVICHSMGAIVGTVYAADTAAAVNALVLLAPAGAQVANSGADVVRSLDSCCGCCHALIASVINGPPPPCADYATTEAPTAPPGGMDDKTWLERGRVLEAWMLAWNAAARHQRGVMPLVKSGARMPFTNVLEVVRARSNCDTIPIRQLPVLLLSAPADPTIGEIKLENYCTIFGEDVFAEAQAGLHCFHLQDAESVHRRVIKFLGDTTAVPAEDTPSANESAESTRLCI